MKIWLLVMINNTEPESKVYIIAAHESEEVAENHKRQLVESNAGVACQVVAVNVDGPQSPILIGVAPVNIMSECKKNTPNDI